MELLKRNGLGDMEVEPFMKYLRTKYGDIYGL